MTGVRKTILLIVLAATIILIGTCPAWAARRWRRSRVRPRPAQMRPHYSGYSVQDQMRRLGEYYYPKYLSGVHAREFDRLGIPSGDRGLRGTAW